MQSLVQLAHSRIGLAHITEISRKFGVKVNPMYQYNVSNVKAKLNIQ